MLFWELRKPLIVQLFSKSEQKDLKWNAESFLSSKISIFIYQNNISADRSVVMIDLALIKAFNFNGL